jgi:hypothetical protein
MRIPVRRVDDGRIFLEERRLGAFRLSYVVQARRAKSWKQQLGCHGEEKSPVVSSSPQETHPTSSELWKIGDG